MDYHKKIEERIGGITMEKKTEKKKISRKTKILLVVFAILAVVFTIMILSKTSVIEDNNDCCIKLCDQFNQECRGWNQDTLECTFNYEKYGFPEVDEIFSFKINQSMKDRVCNNTQ